MINQDNTSEGMQYKKSNPRRNNPDRSYGIVEVSQPDDVLYKLRYSKHAAELRLGKNLTIKTFQRGELPDKLFKRIFYPETEEDKERCRGSVKEVDASAAELVTPVVNNIDLPKSLRKAFFSTRNNGKTLIVTPVITREMARELKISKKEIEEFAYRLTHKTNKD